MKTNLLLVLFCFVIFVPHVLAQNTVKLFDPTVIDLRDPNLALSFETAVAFKTTEIYLSCPLNAQTTISGPNNGNLIIDNFLTINGANICPGENGQGSCFETTIADPYDYLGEIVEIPYVGIAPVNVSSRITTSGTYTFELKDYGYTFGNNEVYLHTTCSFVSQVCHRDNGRRQQRTLTIGASAVAAHLAHGDTEGPCQTS
jgi:hypothetical protein